MCQLVIVIIKGELQRQYQLISSERPSKNETKIIKIRGAVLEICNFKDQDVDRFPRKNDRISKMLFLEVLRNNRLCDVRILNAQLNNKQLEYFHF